MGPNKSKEDRQTIHVGFRPHFNCPFVEVGHKCLVMPRRDFGEIKVLWVEMSVRGETAKKMKSVLTSLSPVGESGALNTSSWNTATMRRMEV